jgi:hypothetical protein
MAGWSRVYARKPSKGMILTLDQSLAALSARSSTRRRTVSGRDEAPTPIGAEAQPPADCSTCSSVAASVHASSLIRCCGNVDKRCKIAAREQGRGAKLPRLLGPQHGDVGHHNNAAFLGGRDQKFHCDLPMLALGFGRQRKDINASIAQASKFAAIAGSSNSRDQPLITAGPAQDADQNSKKGAPSSLSLTAEKFGYGQ